MTSLLELEGMEFHSHHGCNAAERQNGNRFVVDFMSELDIAKAAASDDVKDTVDVAEIHRIVAQEMATPSHLIETVAARIVRAVEKRYPRLEHFSIRVSKQNPPLAGGKAGWSRITVDGGCSC
ncbi:MAG: dihydroneopterin aldolase [Candidatus Cryptobacteroides sp.]